MRRLPVALVIAGFAGVACVAEPAPSTRPGPSIGPASPSVAASRTSPRSPIATPTPVPVVWAPVPTPIPPDRVRGLPVTASVERDGVRVTITLQSAFLDAGQPASIVATVENTGRDALFYAEDCDLVGVDGSMDTLHWRPGFAWQGRAAEYKTWAMESLSLSTGDVVMGFTPEGIAKQGLAAGEYGCGDTFELGTLARSTSVSERSVWNGWATRSYAPPPSGLASLRGSFHIFWREADGPMPEAAFDQDIEVVLPVWVDGLGRPPLVQPTEAVDLALADPVFGPWLLSRPFRDGADWYERYDPTTNIWRIGLKSFNPGERIRVALVDGETGVVIGYEGPTE